MNNEKKNKENMRILRQKILHLKTAVIPKRIEALSITEVQSRALPKSLVIPGYKRFKIMQCGNFNLLRKILSM